MAAGCACWAAATPRLTRNLVDWNKGKGFWLVADDVLGGCFAVNSGGLGTDAGSLYFFAPDSLRWEPMSMGYSQFLQWAMGGGLQDFYVDLRWPNWQSDVAQVRGDDCFNFYPPLWTREGGVVKSRRKVIGIGEQYRQQIDAARQLDAPARN